MKRKKKKTCKKANPLLEGNESDWFTTAFWHLVFAPIKWKGTGTIHSEDELSSS